MDHTLEPMTTPSMPAASPDPIPVLHELDLGGHTLLLMEDGSIDLIAHDEHAPCFAGNALSLGPDETYRLFVSLYEQFQPGGEERVEHEPAPDLFSALRACIERETPWIVPLRVITGPYRPLLAVKDTRLGNLCTAFGDEVDYDWYCSLFHPHATEQGGHHA